MKEKIPSGPNTLKLEHLNPNIKPIMACMDSTKYTDFDYFKKHSLREENNTTNVDWHQTSEYFKENNLLNSGLQSYVISTIDNKNKFSEGFYDCTSLIVSGLDRSTKKLVSFLSHQNPNEFLFRKQINFKKHLEKILSEIKEKCEPNTIDAIIIGGNYLPTQKPTKSSYSAQKYLGSIKLLSKNTEKILGFKPVVINGPKLSSNSDSLYFENDTRRLYFLRPEGDHGPDNFTIDNLKEQSKKWDEKRLDPNSFLNA